MDSSRSRRFSYILGWVYSAAYGSLKEPQFHLGKSPEHRLLLSYKMSHGISHVGICYHQRFLTRNLNPPISHTIHNLTPLISVLMPIYLFVYPLLKGTHSSKTEFSSCLQAPPR